MRPASTAKAAERILIATSKSCDPGPVEGGAVVPLASFLNYGGATWSEDGTIIVSEPLGRGLSRRFRLACCRQG